MVSLAAFDLGSTPAGSKQALRDSMGDALADLLAIAHVAVISASDWPQLQKQVARSRGGAWQSVYVGFLGCHVKHEILAALVDAVKATGFKLEHSLQRHIEDLDSQITFKILGREAPIHAKKVWDPDFAKRKVIQADLRTRLPDLSINMSGATSIDITEKGVDKGYGLRKLHHGSSIPLERMMFIGDAIFPGGDDYPVMKLGLHTVCVRDPNGTLAAIAAIIACVS